MERNGAARSRGPLGSPSASSNKLGCRRLPAPGHRRLTGYPVLLRGELTLDFPLPVPASGGQRSQPLLEPMTDDGPVRPTILPGLGGGGDPSHAPGTPPGPHYLNVGSLIQQASSIAYPPHQTKPKPTTEYPSPPPIRHSGRREPESIPGRAGRPLLGRTLPPPHQRNRLPPGKNRIPPQNNQTSRLNPRNNQNPRYQLTIGIRRSRPKFLGVIFTPGAACRRLYSFRSTALITRFTISSSNPMPMISAGDLSCST